MKGKITNDKIDSSNKKQLRNKKHQEIGKMRIIILSILLIIIAVSVSGCSINPHEKKPFFHGTKTMMVCKRPYSSNNECYNLNVRNDGDEAMVVYFENGGEITLEEIYCTETVYDENICQGKDQEGNTWDVLEVGSKI